MHASVIRHVVFEDLDTFHAPLQDLGYRIEYLQAGVDALGPAQEADLLIVLGGPIGANDEHEFPFLAEELELIRRRLAARQPILGICLGAQLMAKALGARVYPAGSAEIGWAPITPTADGELSALRFLFEEDASVLHWHGDTFDLPPEAILLASTKDCANQAYAIGSFALALQFHAEVSATGLERWFIGHIEQIRNTGGIDVSGLRTQASKHAPGLQARARRFFFEWLTGCHALRRP
jgi:GMP synthase (glutamine-hydrolysing)